MNCVTACSYTPDFVLKLYVNMRKEVRNIYYMKLKMLQSTGGKQYIAKVETH